MSSAGLPNSGQSGYSLLDQEGVTTSEFVEHVDYQRALEGELDNTIGSIQGVQTAQVNLAIPQSDVFTDDTAEDHRRGAADPHAGHPADHRPGPVGRQPGLLQRARA